VHEQAGQRPDDGVLFLTMELVAGTSLGQRLRAEGRLSSEAALPIVQALVAAIGAAHAAGIVHRDFKSDNVMLAPGEPRGSPRVVVMDFGLAHATSLPTSTTSFDRSLTGTLAYMAPEQLEGKPISSTTDIYALGIVMYEMLTGQLPFEGESPLGGAWKRISEKAPSPRKIVPDLDLRWTAIIARCLERDPERRPASVEEVAKALGGAVIGGPTVSTSRAAMLASGAVLAVALMGAGTVVLRRQRRLPLPRPAITPTAQAAGDRVPHEPPPTVLPPFPVAMPALTPGSAAILVPPAPRPSRRPAVRARAAAKVAPPPPATQETTAAPDAAERRRSADPDDGFIF
jgi:hypothetical protein